MFFAEANIKPLLYTYYSAFDEVRNLYIPAAKIPPNSGATIKTQTFVRVAPPTNNAGPKLRAGFTEVPVNEMPNICTKVRDKPITIPETVLLLSFEVTPKIDITKTKVKIISIMSESKILLL